MMSKLYASRVINSQSVLHTTVPVLARSIGQIIYLALLFKTAISPKESPGFIVLMLKNYGKTILKYSL